MGQGLGKNSPVVLSLGKENYEALIARHGQWIRWRVATKCPCLKENSMQPDIHCHKCKGLGVTYGYQPQKVVSQTVMIKDNAEILDLDSAYGNCSLVQVYDNSGYVYGNAEKVGNFITLNTDKLPVKGVYVTAVMTESIVKTLDTAVCEFLGQGYYRVPGLTVSKNNIEGLYHTAPCDIESIEKIEDAAGIEYAVVEKRQNTFYIEPTRNENDEVIPITNPVTVRNVEYIPPFTFALLNQNLTKSDEHVMQELNGDAVLSFPYCYDVSNDDVLTVLSGTYTQKSVLTRKGNVAYDVVPAYFVDEIMSCVGRDRMYMQGTDYVLIGTNGIKWLCLDCPESGEPYSVTYKVYPTYKVVKAIPQLRTSENQRMPKKAVVKLYDTYGDKRGINKQ